MVMESCDILMPPKQALDSLHRHLEEVESEGAPALVQHVRAEQVATIGWVLLVFVRLRNTRCPLQRQPDTVFAKTREPGRPR